MHVMQIVLGFDVDLSVERKPKSVSNPTCVNETIMLHFKMAYFVLKKQNSAYSFLYGADFMEGKNNASEEFGQLDGSRQEHTYYNTTITTNYAN